MADNFHRLFRILQLVPRHPKGIDTEAIADALSSEGIDARRRTLQRDLLHLERMNLGLYCSDDRQKPYKWSFQAHAKALLVPGLDPQAALALRLVELHLERLVPKSTLKALQPHLQAARAALEHKPVARWLDKVRLVSRHQPLLPPKVDGAVTGAVHEALLENKQLQVSYRKGGGDEAKEMTLHPLGLVNRDATSYLVATAWEFTDPRLYPLHRIDGAQMLDEKAKVPAGFHLDAYVEHGELGFRVGEDDIDLVLLFDAAAAKVIEETPLSDHQTVGKLPGARVRVTARVPDTHVLRAWLLGFGASVEVQKPAALRSAIAEAHRAALARYDA